MKTVFFGGSSKSFSSLFEALKFIFSAIQIRNIFKPPSYDFNDAILEISSASSLLMAACLLPSPILLYQSTKLIFVPSLTSSLHFSIKSFELDFIQLTRPARLRQKQAQKTLLKSGENL
jgi:hypothetical protein